MTPVLSIILTGRNDDHGGDFYGRLLRISRYNAQRLTTAGVAFEYVFVEWNPVPGKPLLAHSVVRDVPNARAIVCTARIHRHLCTNPRMVIMEFFAKNAGIRRVQTPWVLTTNADIVLGDDVVGVITALKDRDAAVVWRATRHDVRTDCPLDEAADVRHRLRTHPLIPPFLADGSGDFLLTSKSLCADTRGFDETIRFAKIHKDTRFCMHARLLGYQLIDCGNVYHVHHVNSWVSLEGARKVADDAPWGPQYNWAIGLPYRNPYDWGLAGYPEKQLDERISQVDLY